MSLFGAYLLAGCAAVLALAALVLALLVMRQSGDTTSTLRSHRIAHSRAEGAPDPDRRERNQGPPADVVERRTPDRYRPPTYSGTHRHTEPPRMITVDEPMTAEQSEQLRHELATSELEHTDLPTTMLEAQRPDVPRRQQ